MSSRNMRLEQVFMIIVLFIGSVDNLFISFAKNKRGNFIEPLKEKIVLGSI